MGTCAVCGNTYDKTFTVRMGGTEAEFDSFECAIHQLAPSCAHCGVRIVGHGIEGRKAMYCCASCARHEGVDEARDRVG